MLVLDHLLRHVAQRLRLVLRRDRRLLRRLLERLDEALGERHHPERREDEEEGHRRRVEAELEPRRALGHPRRVVHRQVDVEDVEPDGAPGAARREAQERVHELVGPAHHDREVGRVGRHRVLARARRAVSTSSKPPSIVHDGQSGACGHGSTSAGGRGGVKGWAFGALARRVRGGAAACV